MARAAGCSFDPSPDLYSQQREGRPTRVRLWNGSTPWLVTRYNDQREWLLTRGSAPIPIISATRP